MFSVTPPEIRTRIGRWVYRLVPNERYRATLLLIAGGIAGYLSPPVIAAFTDRLRFPIEVAAIEQLRSDARTVNCGQAQNVLSLVVERNQEIQRKHAERALWYTRYFVAAAWGEVALIAMPCEHIED